MSGSKHRSISWLTYNDGRLTITMLASDPGIPLDAIDCLHVDSLRMLGIAEEGGLWYIRSEKVYTVTVVADNFGHFGFGHCVFFGLFCDLQSHIRMNYLSPNVPLESSTPQGL
jgi:hypothetical protein